MSDSRVLTGAIALIKVDQKVVGKMRDITINESFRRTRVSKGLGSIFADEFAVTEWSGTLSCSFFEVNYAKSGISGAVNRIFGSQILSALTQGKESTPSLEDNLVLDQTGVTVEIFKKVSDIIDPVTKLIKPKLEPYATVYNCFIESDNVSINEGNVAGRNQSFNYLLPVVVSSEASGGV